MKASWVLFFESVSIDPKYSQRKKDHSALAGSIDAAPEICELDRSRCPNCASTFVSYYPQRAHERMLAAAPMVECRKETVNPESTCNL